MLVARGNMVHMDGKHAKAMELRLRGLTYKEIGALLGVSRQRAQQLVQAPAAILCMVRHKAHSRCQICGVQLAKGHVHHKDSTGTKADNYNDLSNLEYLCLGCHRKVHGAVGHPRKRVCSAPECHNRLTAGRWLYCSDRCAGRMRWRKWQKAQRFRKWTNNRDFMATYDPVQEEGK